MMIFLSFFFSIFDKNCQKIKEQIANSMIIHKNDLLIKNKIYYYLFFGRLSQTLFGSQAMNDQGLFDW